VLTLAARIARLFYSLDDYWDDDQFDVDDPHASCSRTMRIGRNVEVRPFVTTTRRHGEAIVSGESFASTDAWLPDEVSEGEVVAAAIRSARRIGCSCDPDVSVQKDAPGADVRHEADCVLTRPYRDSS